MRNVEKTFRRISEFFRKHIKEYNDMQLYAMSLEEKDRIFENIMKKMREQEMRAENTGT